MARSLSTHVRRPVVNLREGPAHKSGALCLRKLVRDPERLHALLVGQQAHCSGPIGAPQTAVEAERLEYLTQRLPDIRIWEGLVRQGTGAGNLNSYVVVGCQRHHSGKLGKRVGWWR